MATQKSSLGDKQAALPKIVKHFKRVFGSMPKPANTPVLETILFGICLEDVDFDRAKKSFDRLREAFLDWNEVRVTTVTELEEILSGLPDNSMRAVRVRQLLMYIYDHQYSYDFEGLRKKTQELVHRQLSRIKYLTPFARNYATQQALGSHVVPLDHRMLMCAVWLGLVPAGANEDEGSDLLKGVIRKADAPEFFYWLKSFSVCKPANKAITESVVAGSAEWDIHDAGNRVGALLDNEKTKVESARTEAPVKEAPAKEASAKEAPAKSKSDAKPEKSADTKRDAKVEKTEPKSDKKTPVAKKAESDARKPDAKQADAKPADAKKRAR